MRISLDRIESVHDLVKADRAAAWAKENGTKAGIGPTQGLAQRFLAKKEADLAVAEALSASDPWTSSS